MAIIKSHRGAFFLSVLYADVKDDGRIILV